MMQNAKNSIGFITRILVGTLCVIFLISIISIAYSFQNNDNLTFGLCITEECVGVIASNFPNILSLLNTVTTLALSAFAVVGILIAAKSYQLSVSSSLINNHINNFNLFSDFVHKYVGSNSYLTIKNIDVYLLYESIHPQSRYGEFNDYREYYAYIDRVRKYLIKVSNSYASNSKSKLVTFDYGKHQEKVILFFREIGIKLEKQHKNDFYLIEEELFTFIDSVSLAFTNTKKTHKGRLLRGVDIHYR
ncbi:hypothetical protein B0W48_13050 [Pseudoalteromonas aliena]|uniref:Uncharacterized protein n=1 Tax=Pseudoalteromonas aliena TaxID=247523 RepID=A0A1Q2GZZ0_9GAMM|nr:retron Ec48 family effector membrane protein [Pseudoalteromonas aliena]AQQ00653.1 hypothetical protein B0W48_13050 [Pseudoalteromonas aliena]